MTQELQELLRINQQLEQDVTQRKQAEAILQQNEEKFRSLIENASDIITILDANGIMHYESPSVERVLGYKPEELVGKSAFEFIHPVDAPDVTGALHYVATHPGETQTAEFRFRHRDGSWRTLQSIGKTVSADAKPDNSLRQRIVVNSRDVTERKQLEELIARAGNYYLTLLEEFPSLVWQAGLDTNCNYFNKTWLAFTGRTMKEEVGAGWTAGVHEDDVERCMKIYLEAFHARQPFEMEYRLRRYDGEYRWILNQGRPFKDLNGAFAGYIGSCVDITERKQSQVALQESEERFRTIVTISQEGIWLLDEEGKTVYVNDRLGQMLGYDMPEMLGRPLSDFMAEASRPEAERYFQLHAQDIAQQHDFEFCRKDGTQLWTIISSSALLDQHGKFMGTLCMLTDITERKQVEQKLLHNAFYDALTGLPNRALFIDRLEHTFAYAKRHEGYLFAVLFLDFDGFKIINDSLGHALGDQLLIAISGRLQACLRSADTVARLGGDEFTVLVNDIEDLGEATHVAERIQQAMLAPFDLQGHEVTASVSIGIALNTKSYEHPENLMRDADTAMYRAKALGRARYEIFDTGMHTEALARFQLEAELRRALEQQEFLLYYQPIVSLATGRIIGFEALVRWQHPQRGLISPAAFVPVAEETGRIVPLDRWVLRAACQQLHIWQERLDLTDNPLTMSVNLSSRHFSNPDLVEQIQQILEETGVAPHALKLEITESAIMDNTESASAMLERLRVLGVQVSMDDFGTGYSSLSYLHRFAFDILKVDRSFVSRMEGKDENMEIVRAIVTLADNLNIDVVAEGVETAEQLVQLRRLQCEYGQGYFFSSPVNSEKAEALLAQGLKW